MFEEGFEAHSNHGLLNPGKSIRAVKKGLKYDPSNGGTGLDWTASQPLDRTSSWAYITHPIGTIIP